MHESDKGEFFPFKDEPEKGLTVYFARWGEPHNLQDSVYICVTEHNFHKHGRHLPREMYERAGLIEVYDLLTNSGKSNPELVLGKEVKEMLTRENKYAN